MAHPGGEMDSDATQAYSHDRPRTLRVPQIGLLLLLCAVAGALVLRWHWRHEFHRRLAAVRAAGYPVTPQEHDAWYEWPKSGDNAAHWILSAADMYQDLSNDDWLRLRPFVSSRDSEHIDPNEPLAADLKDLLERHCQVNAKVLASLHEAAAIGGCRYPVDLSKGMATLMTPVGDVLKGVRLLCFEAVLYAEREDPDKAVEAIQAALSVADSMSNQPVMVSHLLGMAGSTAAATATERILNRVVLSDTQLKTLCRAFQGFDDKNALTRALAGDRCMLYPLFDRPQSVDRQYYEKLPHRSFLELYDALCLSDREGIVFLDLYEECIRIAQLPVCRYRVEVEAAEARHLRGREGLLLRHIGSTSGIVGRQAQYVIGPEMAWVALAVERYRLSHAGLPETLESLVPQYFPSVPEDPFDGMPLRYKRTNRGYLIYSVGHDGKDDAGKVQPPKESTVPEETWDLVFRVQR